MRLLRSLLEVSSFSGGACATGAALRAREHSVGRWHCLEPWARSCARHTCEMSVHAYIFTPRKQHQLWPRPASFQHKHSFSPKLSPPYVPPPPPKALTKQPPKRHEYKSADELASTADSLREQANGLERSAPKPTIRLQLGMLLLEKMEASSEAISKVVKTWDVKGRGEVTRAEVRRRAFAQAPAPARSIWPLGREHAVGG